MKFDDDDAAAATQHIKVETSNVRSSSESNGKINVELPEIIELSDDETQTEQMTSSNSRNSIGKISFQGKLKRGKCMTNEILDKLTKS